MEAPKSPQERGKMEMMSEALIKGVANMRREQSEIRRKKLEEKRKQREEKKTAKLGKKEKKVQRKQTEDEEFRRKMDEYYERRRSMGQSLGYIPPGLLEIKRITGELADKNLWKTIWMFLWTAPFIGSANKFDARKKKAKETLMEPFTRKSLGKLFKDIGSGMINDFKKL